ncbi:MAG: hypothetical protein LBB67_03445 [Oscillospiraceae bacterium]|jgi:hypothetical protein|nr:hypothetical protein [Oscillospiraceae bacterium]
MLKKLLCLALAAICFFSFTACELNADPEQTTGTTAFKILTPEIVQQVIKEIMGEDYEGDVDSLSAKDQKKLRDKLSAMGYNVVINDSQLSVVPPADVSIPETTVGTTMTAPVVLPTGVTIGQKQVDEVYQYLLSMKEIFSGDQYTLVGGGNSPLTADGYSQYTIAKDKDKGVLETTINWSVSAKNLLDGKDDYGQAAIQAALGEASFGNKIRMVFSDESALWVFPDRKLYFDIMDLAGKNANEANGFMDMFDQVAVSAADKIPKDVKSTKVTVDGKEYLTATILDDDGNAKKYFFLGGELKRIEYSSADASQSTVTIIESLKPTVNANMFSVSGYRKANIADLQKIFGGLVG